MYKVQTLNKISSKGLDLLPHDQYEYASEIVDPDAVLVRSQNMNDIVIPDNVKAIARAGAGVNNIPVDKCSERGIVVFNTPGANANGVKELVISALLLSSRRIFEGITWAKSISKDEDVAKVIEKGKSNFAGPEIKGKTLGVIGLGAIGVMVANSAEALGMEVIGYDPYISIDSAWGLSRNVQKSLSLDNLLSVSEYVTLHLPLNENTKGMFDKNKFSIMKEGVRIINFARGDLINKTDLLDALKNGKVAKYVTDFPDNDLIDVENIIPIPHLGASTPESEDNCAIMAVKQLRDYLEYGNIRNSVNYPECILPYSGTKRLIAANKNVPNMIGQITQILAEHKINIMDMLNKSKGDYAYNIIDYDGDLNGDVVQKIKSIKDIIMVRII